MAINLVKGQKIDLSKKGDGLIKVRAGLGWDPVETQASGGFFKKLFSKPPEIDCDASVLMLNDQNKLQRFEDLIFFKNLKSSCGSVVHTGDNLTGEGDGDDESVIINLDKVPANISKLLFVVNIFDCAARNLHFGLIQNAFIRIINESNNQEMMKYNLSDNYDGKTALIVGEMYRHADGWKFSAIGEGTQDTGLQTIVQKYAAF